MGRLSFLFCGKIPRFFRFEIAVHEIPFDKFTFPLYPLIPKLWMGFGVWIMACAAYVSGTRLR
jgi:hypothetical protein